jgi:sugar phosphate isomerase/epimerase
LDEDLAFYKAEGIRSMGVLLPKLGDIPDGLRKIQAAGIRVSNVSIVGNKLIGPDARPAVDSLRSGIDLAAATGAACYFTTGPVPGRMPSDEAYELLVPALKPAVEYAHGKGVRIAIEPNATGTRDNGFIHTITDAAELCRDTGLDICLELQNCWVERHLDRLFREHVQRFAMVQVSDFKIGQNPRMNRWVPGDGDMPLEWLLRRLLDAGYPGLFEIELLGRHNYEEGYAPTIRRSVDWLSERLARWGA